MTLVRNITAVLMSLVMILIQVDAGFYDLNSPVVRISRMANRWPHYNDGEGGVKWLFDCDFPGHDIGHQAAAGEDCGRLCIENSACNAFSHHHGNCYMKNIPKDLGRSPAEGGVCGFLPWEF